MFPCPTSHSTAILPVAASKSHSLAVMKHYLNSTLYKGKTHTVVLKLDVYIRSCDKVAMQPLWVWVPIGFVDLYWLWLRIAWQMQSTQAKHMHGTALVHTCMSTEVERNVLKLHKSQNIVDIPTRSYVYHFLMLFPAGIAHLMLWLLHRFCVSVYQGTWSAQRLWDSSCVSHVSTTV